MQIQMRQEPDKSLKDCSKNMQIYPACKGQVYGIWNHPKASRFVVMRRLPTAEYLEYYRDRRDELYLDKQR